VGQPGGSGVQGCAVMTHEDSLREEVRVAACQAEQGEERALRTAAAEGL
jgi:hypothetical protein